MSVGRGREFVANLFFVKFCSDPKTALKIKSDENGNVLMLSCLVTQNDASYGFHSAHFIPMYIS